MFSIAKNKKHMLRGAVAGLCMVAAPLVAAKGVTWSDIENDAKTPGDVLMYGMGSKAQRFSSLDQINKKNVGSLTPAWVMSFGDEKQRGQEAQALVYDGTVYVTASYSRVFAYDSKTGEKKWSYSHRLPEGIRPCCDVVNRGAAIFGDLIYFGTLDAGIVALDRHTGKPKWKKRFGDYEAGYTMTGAPTLVKDQKTGKVLLIHGSSGDEFGVVGKLFARDPLTGEEIWMRPFVEGHMGRLNGKDSTPTGGVMPEDVTTWPRDENGELVEAWHHGGGAPWQSASFDIETNTIIIGAGNPAPWNTWARTQKGDDPRNWDNLYTSGQVGVDPSTGEVKWFYQHTPNDAWDFSGNNELVLFEYKEKGKTVKATAHADRNGFFYVVNRENGDFIRGFPFVDNITWATHIDPKTGRPVEVEGQRPPAPLPGEERGKPVEVSPPFLGGKNWNPMAYSQNTGWFYLGANHWKEDYWTEKVTYTKGNAYLGQGFRIKKMYDDHVGVLRAIDPKSGKIKWTHKEKLPLWAGVLATKGGLIFTGTSDGFIKAFDEKTGKELWKFQTGSGIISCPITWEEDGEQYIGFASGYGGAVPLWGGDMADLTKPVAQGGSFWVFKLPKS